MSQTHYAAKGDLEFLIHLLPSPEYWGTGYPTMPGGAGYPTMHGLYVLEIVSGLGTCFSSSLPTKLKPHQPPFLRKAY